MKQLNISLLLVNLNVSFGERDHLGQDGSDVQVLHLVPLVGRLVENVSAVSSFAGLPVMNDVGDQVVAGFFMRLLVGRCEDVTEIDVSGRFECNV